MELKEIRVGMVVRLASDGPSMTVESIDEEGFAYCTWFNEKRVAIGQNFRVEAIVKVEPSQPIYRG